MSRPGYWRMADGSDAPIADMRVAHLRNSMRLLGRRIRENASLPTDAGELQRVKTNRRTFYTDKLIELADEAERRGGILPAGDLTEAQLIELVTGWPTARDPQGASQIRSNSPYRPAGTTTGRLQLVTVNLRQMAEAADEAEVIASLPPKRIGIYLNVIREVEVIIGMPVHGIGTEELRPDRRIELDL